MITCTAKVNEKETKSGHPIVGECGFEMEKVGEPITNISSKGNGSLDVKTSSLYQCPSCKTIKLT